MCAGFASFARGPYQVFGTAAFNNNAKSFGIVHLCPTASLGFASGPNNLDVFGDGSVVLDLSETDVSFGLELGVLASGSTSPEPPNQTPRPSVRWSWVSGSSSITWSAFVRSSPFQLGWTGGSPRSARR